MQCVFDHGPTVILFALFGHENSFENWYTLDIVYTFFYATAGYCSTKSDTSPPADRSPLQYDFATIRLLIVPFAPCSVLWRAEVSICTL